MYIKYIFNRFLLGFYKIKSYRTCFFQYIVKRCINPWPLMVGNIFQALGIFDITVERRSSFWHYPFFRVERALICSFFKYGYPISCIMPKRSEIHGHWGLNSFSKHFRMVYLIALLSGAHLFGTVPFFRVERALMCYPFMWRRIYPFIFCLIYIYTISIWLFLLNKQLVDSFSLM